jgi:hypothetical protein
VKEGEARRQELRWSEVSVLGHLLALARTWFLSVSYLHCSALPSALLSAS